MNTSSNNPLNFPPQWEFGVNPIHYHWPQPQICDSYSTTSYSGADFQPFKKLRISEPMMDSTSGMSFSSTSRSIKAGPINANCDFSYDKVGDARELQNTNRGVVVVDDQIRTNFRVSRFRKNFAVTLVNERTEGYKKQFGFERKKLENLNSDGASQMEKSKKAELCKTGLCEKWEKDGSCPSGEKCNSAHGITEVHNRVVSFPTLEPGKSLLLENLAGDPEDASTKQMRTVEKQQKHKKWLIKWNNIEKISRVYADWIESLPGVTKATFDAEF